MPENRDEVIAPLTSLRFFAAFAVVIFHSGGSYLRDHHIAPRPIVTLVLNGYTGVTFFFVLSGFILQFVYSGRLIGKQAIGKFFEARAARIYPVYFLALLLVSPFMSAVSALSIPHLFLLQQWTINGPLKLDNWNMPAWTLSVELLFYVLFPLFSFRLGSLQPRAIMALLGATAMFVVVTGSSFIVSNDSAPQAWMAVVPVPLLRFPEFLMGALLGELATRKRASARVSPWPTPVVMATVVTMASSSGPRVAAIVPLLSAVLVFTIATSGQGRFYALLSWRPLVLLGAASYSLYLLSSPLHYAMAALFQGRKLFLLLQYPLFIGAALFVFRFYEEPVREKLRAHWKMRRSAIAQL